MSPHSTQILQQISQLPETEQLEIIQHLIQHHLPQNTSTTAQDSIIGCFENDPQFDDFLAAIAQYRQQVDAQDPWLNGTIDQTTEVDRNKYTAAVIQTLN